MDDFATTIPEDLMEKDGSSYLCSERIGEFLKSKGVNHIIMMASRITRVDGPCAVSSAHRRYKKLLLKYVTDNPACRISIIIEAEKLVGRRGWPADTIDIPGEKNETRYWETVLSSGRLNMIAALSPQMLFEEIGLTKRELKEFQTCGASVVLLGPSGELEEF